MVFGSAAIRPGHFPTASAERFATWPQTVAVPVAEAGLAWKGPTGLGMKNAIVPTLVSRRQALKLPAVHPVPGLETHRNRFAVVSAESTAPGDWELLAT